MTASRAAYTRAGVDVAAGERAVDLGRAGASETQRCRESRETELADQRLRIRCARLQSRHVVARSAKRARQREPHVVVAHDELAGGDVDPGSRVRAADLSHAPAPPPRA